MLAVGSARRGEGSTHAKFVLQRRRNEPVSREDDVGLRGNRIRKLQEQTSCLSEALRREEDGLEDVAGESRRC